jgi:alpha-tubulin suppressor-like RCC1 family protein
MPFKIFSPAINHNEIRQIECGDNFSGFLTKKGEVFTFGSNDEGQLAIGYKSPVPVSEPTQIKSNKVFD